MTGRNIPEAIKQAVRQECGFGCVICGMPLFEYDHIEEYSVVREHTVKNLALLCPNHHAAKSTGKLSSEQVRQSRESPVNIGRQYSKKPLDLGPSRSLDVCLGSNKVHVTARKPPFDISVIWINGEHYFIIHIAESGITFSLCLTDHNANTIIIIDHGELNVDSNIFDFKYVGTRLEIIAKDGTKVLDVNISNDAVLLNYAMFLDYRTADGFHVSEDILKALWRGKIYVSHAGNTLEAVFGCWGLLNRDDFPTLKPPTGFAWLGRPTKLMPGQIKL